MEIEPGRGVALSIRRSKTDQEGEGATVAILANRADPEFCAPTALTRWLEHRRRGADSGASDRPLFCAVSKGGVLSCETLSDVTVSRLMKDAANACGMDPDAFSGHSARRGYMTAAARMGVSLSDMMKHSRHKTPSVALGYIADAERWSSPALNVFG